MLPITYPYVLVYHILSVEEGYMVCGTIKVYEFSLHAWFRVIHHDSSTCHNLPLVRSCSFRNQLQTYRCSGSNIIDLTLPGPTFSQSLPNRIVSTCTYVTHFRSCVGIAMQADNATEPARRKMYPFFRRKNTNPRA